jgi:hypothetical protein
MFLDRLGNKNYDIITNRGVINMDKVLEVLDRMSNIFKDISESCKQLSDINKENNALINTAININNNNSREINKIKNIIKE